MTMEELNKRCDEVISEAAQSCKTCKIGKEGCTHYNIHFSWGSCWVGSHKALD